jgi:ribosomal protein S18 acetylase RimI-like enzyme
MENRHLERLRRRLAGPRPAAGSGRVEPAADASLRELLRVRLGEFNVGATGIRAYWPVAFQVRDGRGDVVAGVTGWIWGGTCYVEFLWVAEGERGRGLGSQLIEEVERTARERQCHQIALETFSFQAPGFYERLGFESVGAFADYPQGHSMIFVRKRLDPLGRS